MSDSKILTSEEVGTIEAHWISRASSDEEDDGNIGALCATVRQLLEENGRWKRECDEADRLVSKVHDAIYYDPFDRQAASDAVWEVHKMLRRAELEQLK